MSPSSCLSVFSLFLCLLSVPLSKRQQSIVLHSEQSLEKFIIWLDKLRFGQCLYRNFSAYSGHYGRKEHCKNPSFDPQNSTRQLLSQFVTQDSANSLPQQQNNNFLTKHCDFDLDEKKCLNCEDRLQKNIWYLHVEAHITAVRKNKAYEKI